MVVTVKVTHIVSVHVEGERGGNSPPTNTLSVTDGAVINIKFVCVPATGCSAATAAE